MKKIVQFLFLMVLTLASALPAAAQTHDYDEVYALWQEKNTEINGWEAEYPKAVRTQEVFDLMNAANDLIVGVAEGTGTADPDCDTAYDKIMEAYNLAKANYDAAAIVIKVPAGDYIIYNVEAGQYLGGAYDYSTRGCVRPNAEYVTLEFESGKYTINTYRYRTADYHFLGSNLYTDSPVEKWTIAEGTTEGTFTISNASGYIAVDGDNKFLEYVGDATAAKAQWKLIQLTDTDDEDFDFTGLIKDANFNQHGYNNLPEKPWIVEADNKNMQGGGGDFGNTCAESWCSAFNVYQEIENLPNGYYTVTAQAALTDYTGAWDGADYPVVFANDITRPFYNMEGSDRSSNMNTLSNSFSNGQYTVVLETEVTDGKLKLGISGTRTDTWCIWDNFTLTYNADDSSAYDTQRKEEADAPVADALRDSLAVVKGEYDAAKTEIAAIATETEFANNLTVIGNAIETFAAEYKCAEKADSLYARLGQVSDSIAAYVANVNAVADVTAALAEVKSVWQATYDIINTKYGNRKNLSVEFADLMDTLRVQFEESLDELNAIDLEVKVVADSINSYIAANTVPAHQEEVETALTQYEESIIAVLETGRAKAKAAVDEAYATKDSLYKAAIEIVNNHYAEYHPTAAKAAQVKLFAIHEEIEGVKAQADAAFATVVDNNDTDYEAIVAGTATKLNDAFDYASYIKAFEDIENNGFADILDEVDDAAQADNLLIAAALAGEADALETKFYNALAANKTAGNIYEDEANYASFKIEQIAENASGIFSEYVDTIAKDIIALNEKIGAYASGNHTSVETDEDGNDVVVYSCIKDETEAFDAEISRIGAEIDALKGIIAQSDAYKANVEDEVAELKILWNKAYAGIITPDPEADMDQIWSDINTIETNLDNDYFLYDEESNALVLAEIANDALAITDYDAWVVNNTELGDANLDGEVTISDVIMMINIALEAADQPNNKRAKYATDVNGDGTYTVTDAIATVDIALGIEEEETEEAEEETAETKQRSASYLVVNGAQVDLIGSAEFVGFQIDVKADANITGVDLSSNTDHQIFMNKLSNGNYRIIAISLTKAAFESNLAITFNGVKDINIVNTEFTDAKNVAYTLNVETDATAIAGINAAVAEGAEIYTINGTRVNTLQKGINLVKGADGSVKKFLVK